ncbi:hypothetical protein [Streptomyces filamentosus]|nr:hypothetical protein [Streptomyces filamentosus]
MRRPRNTAGAGPAARRRRPGPQPALDRPFTREHGPDAPYGNRLSA